MADAPPPCSRCGTTDPPAPNGLCAKCGVFRAGHQLSRRYQPLPEPSDLQQTSEELMHGVISDLGGESELTTLQKEYVRKLADVDVTIRLLMRDVALNSLFTRGGRVRDVYDKLLSGLGMFDRYAQRLGLERRAKQIDLAAAIEQEDRG